MRILLTGVSGQIGSALRAPLASLGTVIAADRTLIDLSRPADVTAALNKAAPDLIINPAAFTAVDQAELEPELAYRVNAEAPREMARWAASRGFRSFIFQPTAFLTGRVIARGVKTTPPDPCRSTARASWPEKSRSVKPAASHLVIRTSWVFASKGRNFLNTIVRSAREQNQLRIVSDQVGAPTSARLIAEALTSILHRCRSGAHGDLQQKFREAEGLVHLTASGETSRHGFACAIVDGLRKRGDQLAVADIAAIKTRDYQARAARPHNSRLSMARLEKVFEIRTPDWRQALDLELDDLAFDRHQKCV